MSSTGMLEKFLLPEGEEYSEEERRNRTLIATILPTFLTSLKENYCAKASKENIKEIFAADVKCPSDDWRVIKVAHFKEKAAQNAVDCSFEAIPRDDVNEEQEEDDADEGGAESMTRGQKIHDCLAQKVNDYGDTRYDGKYGRLIRAIENRLKCRFVRAEVAVYGFSLNDDRSKAKQVEQLFWRGAIDAIGVTKEGDLFLVEWKSLSRTEKFKDFWMEHNDAGYVPALHQSLLYRKLLEIHLRAHEHSSKIFERPLGIMIVPVRMDFRNVNDTDARICWSFEQIEKARILDGVKNLAWKIDQFELFKRVDFKANVFDSQKGSNERWYTENVEQVDGNRVLKDTAPLTDIFDWSATVQDLREALTLPPLVDVESD